MPWKTTSCPLGPLDLSMCDAAGCRQLARSHFVSIEVDTQERRVAVRCTEHAEEMRAKIGKRRVAAGPAPKPVAPDPEAFHHCHARGCLLEVPPRLLMCSLHWRMVPKDLQAQVWAHYRPGQEISKDPTTEYLDVMEQAIAAVAVKEAKPKRPPKIYQIPEHHSVTTCTSCVAAIIFVQSENGRPMPVEPYGEHKGEPHWIHCPNADAHRGAR